MTTALEFIGCAVVVAIAAFAYDFAFAAHTVAARGVADAQTEISATVAAERAGRWSVGIYLVGMLGMFGALKITLWLMIPEAIGLYYGSKLGLLRARRSASREVSGSATRAPGVDPIVSGYITTRRRDVADFSDLAPGEYVQVTPKDPRYSHMVAVRCCPGCGKVASITRQFHAVDHFGQVHPQTVCQTNGCHFVGWLMLDDWRPETRGVA